MAKIEGVNGVWRTVGGRRIFIKDGEDLASAMKRSGKFKSSSKKPKIGDERDKKFDDQLEKYKDKTEGELRRIIHESDDEVEKMSAKKLLDDMKEEDKNIAKTLSKEEKKSMVINHKFNNEDEAFIKDLTEHYDEFTRGDLQGTIEAKYGMGEKGQAILKEVDDRTYEKYKVDALNNDEYLQANRPNEYFQKQLKESGDKTFADEIKEKEDRIKISNQQETNRHIKNATSQKSLKAMAEAGYAKDITRNSFEANEELREKHGRLERIKTIKGAYGINGAILRSRETGEYFVITARNSNIDYWI